MIKTTIVCFGDSLTYGCGVASNINYADRLERFLPQYYPAIAWQVINSGVNGDTTREARARLQKDVLRYNPNIVFILFGSNDSSLIDAQFRSPDEFSQNITFIIEKIKAHNNRTGLNFCIPIPVFITIPPVVEDLTAPFHTNARIHIYNEEIQRLAKVHHCPVIDFNRHIWEESQGVLAPLFQSDGLHLSRFGYNALYDAVFSGLSRLISYEGILKEYDTLQKC